MKFRELKSPINVQWELTPNCNYCCFHCYNYWRTENNVSGHIDYGIVVEQLIKNHIYNVTLTGGEPLLVYSDIKSYIEKMVNAGIKVSINTNASLLTQEMARFFKENDIGLLISLPCCVPEINDRITTVEGSFEKTVNGIKLARRNNLKFAVNMVVSKLNKDYVIKTAEFLHDDLGISAINVTKACRPLMCASDFDNYALDINELRQVFNDLLYVKKKYSMFVDSLTVYPECMCNSQEMYDIFSKRKCYAGKTALAIGYNGDVKACARDNVSYGNLKNKSLKECWDAMACLRKLDYEKLPKECRDCDVVEFCEGGCRLENLNEIPNKCCRDKDNLPIKYMPNISKKLKFLDSDEFEKIEGIMFFEETFGMRGINLQKKTFFITKILYEFLISNSTFSKKDIMEKFSISSKNADYVLDTLVKDKAIKII